ncbi:MAG: glycosyltransferase family 39 protein [Bdellovibrionales bacterium]|nr:glycosyltransferase family 39 protein [Bdellovibrionales bacterium]
MRNAFTFPGYLIWIFLAYLASLSLYTVPLTGDQKVYLAISQEMWNAGSVFQPLLFDAPSYVKPPLQYLSILLSWKIFGVGLFSALLPSVLALLGTSAILGKISLHFQGREFASNAGLWFAASVGAWVFGTVAQMEILLCFMDALAWFFALQFLARTHWPSLFLAFVFAGLNAWVKSPVYSVFWVAGFLLYLFMTGNWWVIRHRRFYAAGFLGVCVGLVWYVAMFRMDPQNFWDQYFVQETFSKKNGNASTPLGLWGALLYWAFPGTLLLIPGVLRALRLVRAHRPLSHVWTLAICWVLPAFAFFSLHPYRVKPYLFVLVPPLMLVLDWTITHCRNDRVFVALLRSSGIGIAGLAVFASAFLIRAEWISWFVAAALMIASILALWAAWKRRLRGFAFSVILVLMSFRFAAADLGSHDLADLVAWSKAHPTVQVANLDPGKNVWNERTYVGLGIDREIGWKGSIEDAEAFVRQGGHLILSDEQWQSGGWSEKPGIQFLEWRRFKTRRKFPYGKILLQGRAALPNFDDETHRKFRIVTGLGAETRKSQ